MSNIRYILRLHTQNIGNFEIIKQTGIMRSTLKKYISDFKKSGLAFEEINELSDEDLEELFIKPEVNPTDIRLQKLLSLFPQIDKKLKSKGITRQSLWEEYISKNPDGYNYGRFTHYYAKWKSRPKPVMRIEHKAGDKLYIDFAGEKLSYINPNSGNVTEVEVFVTILGASQLTYVEAVMSQGKEDFISACENALHFYGGVPGAIVCDNLRSAVNKSNKYEPSINETFADFAEHYNVAILPTRAYKPKDKALVENAVKLIYSRIYTKLREQKHYSLEALNKAICLLLEENHNKQVVTGKNYTRRQQFQNIEKSALLPLPLLKYELKQQVSVTVAKNGHVSFPPDKHFYSVPYSFIGRKVKVLFSSEKVDIYHEFERIASHRRNRTPFIYTTNKEHLFPPHHYAKELASERFITLAEGIHADVKHYVTVILNTQKHLEQAYRLCTGIIGFARKVGNERLTQACRKATSIGVYNYKIIKKILEQGLDRCEEDAENLKMPQHNNIRGNDYYIY